MPDNPHSGSKILPSAGDQGRHRAGIRAAHGLGEGHPVHGPEKGDDGKYKYGFHKQEPESEGAHVREHSVTTAAAEHHARKHLNEGSALGAFMGDQPLAEACDLPLPAEERDPVVSAAIALAKEAMLSESAYTPGQVGALASEAARVLHEVGGFVSWVRRAFTGMDSGAVAELQKEIDAGIKTEKKKAEIIGHIGKLIGEAEQARREGGLERYIRSGVPGLIMRGANQKSGSLGRYVNALEKVRRQVQQAKPHG